MSDIREQVDLMTKLGLSYGTAYQIALLGVTAEDVRKINAACEATGQDTLAVLQSILTIGFTLPNPLPKFNAKDIES